MSGTVTGSTLHTRRSLDGFHLLLVRFDLDLGMAVLGPGYAHLSPVSFQGSCYGVGRYGAGIYP